jgi:IMP dehydrogenase/GMP reductase
MTESNNVRFVQDESKWVWKCYDANGSVIHRSELFDTEQQAREDYEVNGGQYKPEASAQANQTSEAASQPASAPEDSNTAGSVAPEGEVNAGTTAPEAEETNTNA